MYDHTAPAEGSTSARPLVVIIGPSGCGKSGVVAALHRRGLVQVHPTWTTRSPRPAEMAGCLEHRFVTEAAFDDLVRQRFFQGTARPFGLPYCYGLPQIVRRSAGPADLAILRAASADHWASALQPAIVYQLEDAPERLQRRLLQRGGDPADIAARLKDNALEVEEGRRLADRIFVNDSTLDALVHQVAQALWIDLASGRAVA